MKQRQQKTAKKWILLPVALLIFSGFYWFYVNKKAEKSALLTTSTLILTDLSQKAWGLTALQEKATQRLKNLLEKNNTHPVLIATNQLRNFGAIKEVGSHPDFNFTQGLGGEKIVAVTLPVQFEHTTRQVKLTLAKHNGDWLIESLDLP